jgi:serine/threonine-protein kinase
MPDEAQRDTLVVSLLEQTLALPLLEREAYLRAVCADVSKLFGEVWNYIQLEQRTNGLLFDPLVSAESLRLPFQPGELLDARFRIVREVAQAGMGVVYEALDDKLLRRIAIKCGKPAFCRRLPAEVRNATEISHPNVCKIFEIHTVSTSQGEIDFVTMEFLEGETLAKRLGRELIPEAESRTIARQLCAGLAEAHRKHVIHGDLKSNNIILNTQADGAVRAVITDFGLARRSDVSQPTLQSGRMGGTPGYMAPELWRGEQATVASDVYALGVILYELAGGRRAHETEVSWPVRYSRKALPVHPNWQRILSRCLDPDPPHTGFKAPMTFCKSLRLHVPVGRS